MNLSNLNILLTWIDLKLLLANLNREGFAIHDINPVGESVTVEGEATKKGFLVNWAVCIEPMKSDDGRCLVFCVKSIKLKERLARYAVKFLKDFIHFDWSHNSEDFLWEMLRERTKEFPLVRIDGKCLMVDLVAILSTIMGMPESRIQVATIKHFSANAIGIRLVIGNA